MENNIIENIKRSWNLPISSEEEKNKWPYKTQLNYSPTFLIEKEIEHNSNKYIVEDIYYEKCKVALLTKCKKKIYLSSAFLLIKNPHYGNMERIHLNPSRGGMHIFSSGYKVDEIKFKNEYYSTDEYLKKIRSSIVKNNLEEIKKLNIDVNDIKSAINVPSLKKKISSSIKEKYGADWFLRRHAFYGEKITSKIYENYKEKSFDFLGISKKEIEIINCLVNHENLKGLFSDQLYFFSDKNSQFSFLLDNDYWFSVDFFDKKNKLIIEINGDYWHGNPEIYKNKNQINKLKNKTFEQIRSDEKKKIEKLKEKYDVNVIVIWESNWEQNKELEIKKIFKYLNENKENRI